MKLLPAVEYIKLQPSYSNEYIVITIDDDVIYPREMIVTMVDDLLDSNAVVGAMMYKICQGATKLLPRKYYPWKFTYKSWVEYIIHGHLFWKNLDLRKRQFIVGHGGVAYKASWIDTDKLIRYSQSSRNCVKSDDLVISFFLNENNIPIAKLKNSVYGVSKNQDMEHGSLSYALHNIDVNEIKYLGCYTDLLQKFGNNKDKNVKKSPVTRYNMVFTGVD